MRPIDLSKFRKSVNKSLGLDSGFHDARDFISSGNYALNYMISNDFNKGFPLGKVSLIAGESGSGKSYIASGNVIKDAQKQGILPIILDSEFALDEAWLRSLGVNTDPSQLMRFPVSLVDDVAKLISDFMEQYKSDYGSLPYEERAKVLFVVDSLGMLSVPAELTQFQEGNMKGTLGHKPKALKALITQCLKLFGPHPVGMVATQHSYASQDMYNPDDVISGGSGFIYASSIVVLMKKYKLKEDEDGNKTSTVQGIRSKIKCVKSRYAKPFEEVTCLIPWTTGMNPTSGLVDLFEGKGLLVKDGNRLAYTDLNGEIHKFFRKNITDEFLHKMMDEFTERMKLESAQPLAIQENE